LAFHYWHNCFNLAGLKGFFQTVHNLLTD
jgi:hypothetical protein